MPVCGTASQAVLEAVSNFKFKKMAGESGAAPKNLKLKLATELLEEICKDVRFVGGQC